MCDYDYFLHISFAIRFYLHIFSTLLCTESVPMVLELIDQVLELHPDAKWFHIGGDEV